MNIILQSYGMEGRIDDMLTIYEKIKKMKGGPNTRTFNIMILHISK